MKLQIDCIVETIKKVYHIKDTINVPSCLSNYDINCYVFGLVYSLCQDEKKDKLFVKIRDCDIKIIEI